jgi:nitroreductase
MTLNLSFDEVLTTTRSVRKRLDFDKPVSREVLMECLELALQAPTGSNSQGWQWVFVADADKKKAIGEVYLDNARGYLSSASPEYARETHVVSEWARYAILRPILPSTCMRRRSC